MPSNDTANVVSERSIGIAREFAEFCKGERQRYVNTEHEADPLLFDEAVAYILQKLSAQTQEGGA